MAEYRRGQNPESLKNLTREGAGRHRAYDEEKKTRTLTVTQTGWDGAQAASNAAGCTGISDMLEKLGRGELRLSNEELPE